jgi:hypothetical protein
MLWHVITLTNCLKVCYCTNRILEVFEFSRPRRLFDFVVFFVLGLLKFSLKRRRYMKWQKEL